MLPRIGLCPHLLLVFIRILEVSGNKYLLDTSLAIKIKGYIMEDPTWFWGGIEQWKPPQRHLTKTRLKNFFLKCGERNLSIKYKGLR